MSAAKYEEQEIRVPPVDKLQQTANNIYSQLHIKQMEVRVAIHIDSATSGTA
jgi:hypothetical protein